MSHIVKTHVKQHIKSNYNGIYHYGEFEKILNMIYSSFNKILVHNFG